MNSTSTIVKDKVPSGEEENTNKHLELAVIIAAATIVLIIIMKFLMWIFTGGCIGSGSGEHDEHDGNGVESGVLRPDVQQELSTDVWPPGGAPSSPGPAAEAWMPTSRIEYACEWADRELLYLQRGGLLAEDG